MQTKNNITTLRENSLGGGRQISPNDDVSGVRFTTCDPRNRCRVQNRITGDTILITITAGVEAGSLGFTATGGELFSLLSFSR